MKKILEFIVALSLMFTLLAVPASAQTPYGIGCGGGVGPIGALFCSPTPPTGGGGVVGTQLNKTLSGIIGFLTIVAALWFLIQFILAGFAWISAGGDKAAVEAARNKITNALIGLILVIAAWIIAGVLGAVFGIEILNPGNIIQTLGII
jgi:hypothetical protein